MPAKRILILTNRIPYPLKDGGAMAMQSMIEGYEQAGWQTTVYSMNTSRHYVPLESLPDIYRRISFEAFDIDTDIRVLPTLRNFLLSRKPNHAERFYNKAYEKQLQKIIERTDPDFIQIESIYLATYLPIIRQLTKEKIELILQNIEYEIWENLATSSTNKFKKFYLKDLAARIKKFESTAWKQVDLLLPITIADSEVVKKEQNLPMLTVPFGIELGEALAEVTTEKWIGYHLGAMDWLPNIDAITWFLEQVWPNIHKELPNFEFHFAGRNMPASFKKYETDGIVCSGEVPDAYEFIADKKILIVPLQAGSGVRIKVMEAMAAKKLVVSTSIGMQGIDGAKHGEHFLLANEPDQFVHQLKWALTNKALAAKIADNGAELIKKAYNRQTLMQHLTDKIFHISGW